MANTYDVSLRRATARETAEAILDRFQQVNFELIHSSFWLGGNGQVDVAYGHEVLIELRDQMIADGVIKAKHDDRSYEYFVRA